MNIGTLNNDNYLVKRGKQAVLFRNFDGFGVDISVLDKINGVEIHHGGKVYRASSRTFGHKGQWVDFNHGTQLVLKRKDFDEVKNG